MSCNRMQIASIQLLWQVYLPPGTLGGALCAAQRGSLSVLSRGMPCFMRSSVLETMALCSLLLVLLQAAGRQASTNVM